MGVVAMKVMGWVLGRGAGRHVPDFDPEGLRKLPACAIRWVRSDTRVHLMCIGMSMKTDVDHNVQTLAEPPELSLEDRVLLASFSAKAYELPNYKL
jgi:hypothetical protein